MEGACMRRLVLGLSLALLAAPHVALADAPVEAVRRSVSSDPDQIQSTYRRAHELMAQSRYPEALQETSRLVSLNRATLERTDAEDIGGRPLNMWAATRLQHAEVLVRLGRQGESEPFVAEIMGDVPTAAGLLARARYRYAVAAADTRLTEAVADARAAVTYDNDYAFAWWSLGQWLFEAKRYGEALEAIENAIEYGTTALSASLPEILWMRAGVLSSLQRTREAAEAGIAAIGEAISAGSSALSEIFSRLRDRGYWQSAQEPEQIDGRVAAAVFSCMNDKGCPAMP